MTIDHNTRVTLGKMFGMLGSEYDAEVLAAVRAIKRRMDAAQVTFGELANIIAGEDVSKQVIFIERDNPLAEMAAAILKNGLALDPRERQFVEQMLDRFRLNSDFRMSDKQNNWFTILHSRCVTNRFETELL